MVVMNLETSTTAWFYGGCCISYLRRIQTEIYKHLTFQDEGFAINYASCSYINTHVCSIHLKDTILIIVMQ